VVTEAERTEPASLCLGSGALDPDAVGWTRHPLHRCNLSGHWPHKKRWNCWTVFTDRTLFSATVADVDYATVAFIYLVDLRRGSVVEKRTVLPFGIGAPPLPEHVEASLSLRTRQVSVSMIHEDDHASLLVAWENFLDGDRLSAAFQVQYPAGHESLGVAAASSRRRFAYTCRNNGLPAQGRIRIGYRELSFDIGTALAMSDFGRGIWPYRAAWNHAAACGRTVQPDGGEKVPQHVLAFDLGGKWTDGTGVTENAVWIDGRLSRVPEELTWEINNDARWRIHAPVSRAIDLHLVPSAKRTVRIGHGLPHYDVHQVFGHFSGTLLLNDGEPIEVRDLFGWASRHRALW